MAHRITKLIILGIFISGLISSCYYDNEEELYPISTPCDTAVQFSTDIFPIFEAKCNIAVTCHGTDVTSRPQWSNYQTIKDNINLIKTRTVDQMTMPPSSVTPLSNCEIQQLETWINKGAPQN